MGLFWDEELDRDAWFGLFELELLGFLEVNLLNSFLGLVSFENFALNSHITSKIP